MDQIIVLLWCGDENYHGILKVVEGKTIDEQLRQYEKDNGYNTNTFIGFYDTLLA